jgi:hypothetical protein
VCKSFLPHLKNRKNFQWLAEYFAILAARKLRENRIAFTAACPEAVLFAGLVRGCLPAGP